MAVAKKEEKKSVFEVLSAINVNEHTEKKRNATYLTWAWAWAIMKKNYPDTTYKIGGVEYDETLGFMVHTEVTVEEETLEMWLPVMDGANKSMKKTPWTYSNKYKEEKTVEAATTFDINKAKMRCLVKNLAMFGLGIYIYSGEDLPEEDVEPAVAPEPVVITKKKPTKKKLDSMVDAIKSGDVTRITKVREYLPAMVDGDDKQMIIDLLTPKEEKVEEQQEPPHEHKAVEEIPLPPPPPENLDEPDDLPF